MTDTVLKGITGNKMPRTYLTHDNGGRAFAVVLSSDKAEIYRMVQTAIGPERGMKLLETKYTRKWIGDNQLGAPNYAPKGQWPGNSILIERFPGQYIHVGREVYCFGTRNQEAIVEYYSPVGNSDVPYPYAIGKTYTYFLLDKKTVPNYRLDLKQDAYRQFYDGQPELRRDEKKFRIKTLAK